MMEESPLILVIDDEEAMRDSCAQILLKDHFRVKTAEEGTSGLRIAGEMKPDLVIIDLKMPGISGFEVLEALRRIDPEIVAVVITGYATVESAVEAMKRGAYDFLPKPFAPEELRIIIRRGLERRRLAREAESLRREKILLEENILTMVSHQLRSPLAAIQQYFEVILAGMVGTLNEKQKEMICRARERLDRLLRLINDWLDLARINRGGLAGKFRPFDLKKTVERLVEFMKPGACDLGITAEVLPCPAPIEVLGDEETLEQVIANLLSNAIQYNRPGGEVRVEFRESPEDVAIEVRDTGIGIAKEHLPFIFDQFYQVSRSERIKTKGTGLGLSIAKKIVEAHGGTIQVQSEPGKGSVFTVRIPKNPVSEPRGILGGGTPQAPSLPDHEGCGVHPKSP
jgi:two-component system sensor histidine kinase/response regulator